MSRTVLFHRSESQVVAAICDYLRLKRYYFWRQNNGGVWDAGRGAYRVNKNTVKGVADIFVLDGNRIIALEVKSDTGRQSPEQRDFEAWFDCPPFRQYYLVRSVDDVIKKAGL